MGRRREAWRWQGVAEEEAKETAVHAASAARGQREEKNKRGERSRRPGRSSIPAAAEGLNDAITG